MWVMASEAYCLCCGNDMTSCYVLCSNSHRHQVLCLYGNWSYRGNCEIGLTIVSKVVLGATGITMQQLPQGPTTPLKELDALLEKAAAAIQHMYTDDS